uniref:cysteine--tRNA ligase n=1 Tax=Arcella intermedia TaxID=1963864 RepID=A0A6B2KYA1_9EUKA
MMVLNSLKKDELVELVPNEGNVLRWYTCGPTVYDSSHLGHARNYVTFDFIRRIISDYFGYEVFYCMNITDIDDKIILRSRRNYLISEYIKKNPIVTETLISDLNTAWPKFINGLKEDLEKNLEEQKKKPNKQELKAEADLLTTRIKQSEDAFSAQMKIIKLGENSSAPVATAEQCLGSYLDKLYGKDLDSELVKKLCDQHSKKFEKEFFDDMKALGIQPPDVLVRVSEYVPEVIEMVQQIIENGYGYESEGSVYFDIHKFHHTPGHAYAKLKPSSAGNLKKFAEGEGALAATEDRISKFDFALWKKSKPGEPSWPSPWGPGRPGWHIECSAMASVILGKVLDVHCGGVDLKFPHHDNELAQAEACYGHDQWVNYFLHSGHLDIDGLKMSKSMKNFITIREAFQKLKYTPRQLRFYFLLHTWCKRMNFQVKEGMGDIEKKEKFVIEFLTKVKQLISEDTSQPNESWTPNDVALHNTLLKTQTEVDAALKNNFDTKTAILLLIDLISAVNSYLSSKDRKTLLVSKIRDYVLRIFGVFGLNFSTSSVTEGASGVSTEDIVRPYARALVDFRNQVREGAKKKEGHDYFLVSCDNLRDKVTPPLGIKIVDDGEFDFYLVDKDQYLEELKNKQIDNIKAQIQKKTTQLKAKETAFNKWEDLRISPSELVLKKYNVTMESEEVPALNNAGGKVSDQNKKKILTDWKKQLTNNTKFNDELAKNPEFYEKLKNDYEKIKKEIQDLQSKIPT